MLKISPMARLMATNVIFDRNIGRETSKSKSDYLNRI